MQSFTGPEIAALLDVDRFIAARDSFSSMLKAKLSEMPEAMRSYCGYHHWIEGVYLITAVERDSGVEHLNVFTQAELAQFITEFGEGLTITRRDVPMRLVAAGTLEGVPEDDLLDRLRALEAPCTLTLVREGPPLCGEDHITAVDLTSPLEAKDSGGASSSSSPGNDQIWLEKARSKTNHVIEAVRWSVAGKKSEAVEQVQVHHMLGGPVEMSHISQCIVLGGQKGWTVITKQKKQSNEDIFEKSLRLAVERGWTAHSAQGGIWSGERVRVDHLQSRSDLNGKRGLTLAFDSKALRWGVEMETGERVRIKSSNLSSVEGVGSGRGCLYVFWGSAQWTRTQLLGEIAKGDWGLCAATAHDMIDTSTLWKTLTESQRLAFAPVSEMTEEHAKSEREEMERIYQHGLSVSGNAEGNP